MVLLLALLIIFFFLAPPWSIVVLIVACLLEVIEITLLRRWSKRIDRKTAATTGTEAMIGKRGEVVDECAPSGTVRVGGELWEARCDAGAEPGDSVWVQRVEGLTLVVSPHGAGDRATP